ncbi:NADH:ubiquinone reductase (H(+)-translocating) [Trifolium repens]|nr:NADH:ubiquinone reductase (H(+)-translocating) [Trifolium repens]
MTARSSNEIVQEPFNPTLPPIIDLNSENNLVYQHNQTDAGPDAYDFYTEKFVDFDSLKANGIDIQSLFYDQQWENYFEMLNGFVYYDIVKYFWQKAKVYDRASADEEYRNLVAKNKALRGKTRQELGLKPYRGREIRSNILGINVVITQTHIAKILGLDNKGEDIDMYDKKSKHLDSINQDLFKPGSSNKDFGKIKFMRHKFEFAFRVFLDTIVTRKGGLDTISIPHKHFIWFLYKKVKVNLAKILFDHLCLTISESRTKIPSNIHHPRLISELIRQTKLTDILSAKEKLRVFQTAEYDATVLVNMKRKTKEEIIPVKTPLQQVYEKYFWCDGFPTISEHDNEDVIKNFIEIVRRDTGVRVPRKMVVSVPNWEIFKGPREITRSKRKPKTTEQEIVDEGSDDQENDNTDEVEEGESGAGDMAAEDVQKEKRSKKRNDRPPASEEDQNPAKPAKRLKTRASKPKGKLSKSNTTSIPVAQDMNSEPQPSTAQPSISQPSQPPNQANPIDFTVPLSVVLPDSNPLSSSSSDTSTDSEELIAKLTKEVKKKQKKIHLKKTTKRTTTKPIQISSDEDPPIIIDTTIPEQPGNPESVLDHLQQHLSGDAFTHSNPNSPPRFPFINTTADSIAQEPPTNQVIQTPPPSLDHISQENPPSFTPVQDETIAHSEAQQESPHHSPDNVIAEQQPPSPQPEFSTPEPSPKPSPEPLYGPLYKPLILEEVLELYNHLFKAEEQILKDAINIDDDIITPNLSKIKIINLKRKKPEPAIPFDPFKPFFNSDSEPNLELLNNAIGLRLKRFKQMDEEVLIFPSDFDAEVREMEYLFSQSLKILSTHLKNKTQGRGMNTIRNLFEIAERSRAPRITFYNHVEEQNRLRILTAIEESLRTATVSAQMMTLQEAEYLKSVEAEQAKIAAEAEQKRQAEIEHKRLADQEAIKLLVSMGTHIATIETNKILADQVVAENLQILELIQPEQENIDMVDQSPVTENSNKGKTVVVDKTPPASPKIEKGSPSSEIPPAVQKALDSIRTELAEDIKDEIDELRVDLKTDLRADLRADFRADITASEENTRQRMDAMMETLLKAIADIKKP